MANHLQPRLHLHLPPPPVPPAGRGRRGQAMIEFTIALLVVVLLVTGILQFVELAGTKGRLLQDIRGTAGLKSLSSLRLLPDSPEYLRDWREGNDEMRHTADDQAVRGQAGATLQEAILSQSVATPAAWHHLDSAINFELPTLYHSAQPMAALGFYHTRRSEEVELLPAMSNWVYGHDHITVAAEIWLPRLWLEGFDQ